jgi:hypothetical protein
MDVKPGDLVRSEIAVAEKGTLSLEICSPLNVAFSSYPFGEV